MDNTVINPGSGGDPIATDELVTLNGAAVTGVVKAQRMKVGFGSDGIFRDVDAANPLPILNTPEGVVSTVNSTVVNLAANAVFTGTAEDVSLFANIKINAYSSHASATNGLAYQFSHDGTFWPTATDLYTIPAVTQKSFSVGVNMKFFRVVYTNGTTLTTQIVIQSVYHKSDKQPSSVRPQDGRANDNDFVEVLSYLMGYNSVTDAWNRIGITNAVTGGNENLIDRIKVNAALRMIDNAQPSGSKLVNVTGSQALGMDVNMSDRAARILGNLSELRAATLAVTVTAATGVAATLTIPAVAAQFHYITSIEARLYSTAARTGTATPILVTTTNIPGTPSLTFDTAGAIGTSVVQQPFAGATPLKSSVVNTATTIVAPIVTGGIWRITATYFTGA